MHTDNIFFLKNHEVLRLLSNREREIVEMVGQAASNNSIAVFSPFGLGILDLALAKMAYELAMQSGNWNVHRLFSSACCRQLI